MRFKWREWTPFASTAACILVGVLGIVLLVHHPKANSATDMPSPSSQTTKAPSNVAQATLLPPQKNANPSRKSFLAAITKKGNGNQQTSVQGSVNQNSSGPNSPNIVGNGNQVTYSDTSELKSLSDQELSEFSSMLSGTKYKLMIRFNGADQDAEIVANQLVNTAKKIDGWDANWMAGLGGGPVLKVPILVVVKDAQTANSNEAQAMLRAISAAEGYRVPAIIDDQLVNASNEVDIFLQSRPIKSNP